MKQSAKQYFHVVVWTTQSGDHPTFLFGDLSEKELRRQFLKPYRTGGKFFVRQKILNVADLTAVKIIETPHPKDEALKVIQADSLEAVEQFNRESSWATLVSAGYGGEDEDIVYADDDVTERYIKHGPGSPNLMNQVLHNQWFLALGSGLILLAIGAWFGV